VKKFLALFCALTLIFCLFTGCEKQEKKPKGHKELYNEFLRGEITALDESGEAKHLDGGYAKVLSDKAYHCFIDMNGDGVEELCVENPHTNMFFFTVKEGKVYHWYTLPISYTKLLNNGGFLYERPGAAPEHINYKYHELDVNGEIEFSIEFSWWDDYIYWETGKHYPVIYEIDGVEVSKEEYEEKTSKYFGIGSDKIVWYDKYGNRV
jgi:hypothetical protein